MINILIASGNDEERENILTTVSNQNGFNIVSVEKDDAGIIIKSDRLKPDVVVIDLHSPVFTDGPELAAIIKRKSPSSSIIIMCDKDDNDYAVRALKAGITGFLLRKTDMDKLVYAIMIVNLGGFFISASITMRALDTISFYRQFPGQLTRKNFNRGSFLPSLSKTEVKILTNIAKGLTDNEIAEHLDYNAGYIRNILLTIKKKTKLKNRIQIVLFSLVFGLINLEYNDFIRIIEKQSFPEQIKNKPIDNSP